MVDMVVEMVDMDMGVVDTEMVDMVDMDMGVVDMVDMVLHEEGGIRDITELLPWGTILWGVEEDEEEEEEEEEQWAFDSPRTRIECYADNIFLRLPSLRRASMASSFTLTR